MRSTARGPSSVGGGRYTLGDLIGRGGAAEVFRARDELLGRDVAVRLFPAGVGGADESRRGRELWALAGMNHPGLVTIYDVGREGDHAYLVMQLIEGESVAGHLRSGPLPQGDVVALGAALADALTYVHRRGVVHRDVTPGNVLLDTHGRPRLTNFGIAGHAHGTDVTPAGQLFGSATYLSPEQVRGEQVGPASDVYALGLVLLECITARREYPGDLLESAVARLHRAPEIPPDLPAPLGNLLRAMVASDPTERPTTEQAALALRSMTREGGVGRETAVPAPAPGSAAMDAQVTAYHPTLVAADVWYPLVAFVHRAEVFRDPATGRRIDPVEEVAARAARAVADVAAPYGGTPGSRRFRLVRGDEVLLQPWLDDGEVDPPDAVVRWEEPIEQVDFRMRVSGHVGRQVKAGLRIFRGVVPLGEVEFLTTVSRSAESAESPLEPTPMRRFRSVFVSYSHDDEEIVERVLDHCRISGDRYLRDRTELGAGERWEPRLFEMIREADAFQLFWSHNAMRSDFVQRECAYALGLGRERFVLPVYWEEPRPSDRSRGLPPRALDELQWTRLGRVPVSAEVGSRPRIVVDPEPSAASATSVASTEAGVARAPRAPGPVAGPTGAFPVPPLGGASAPRASPRPAGSRRRRVVIPLVVAAALVLAALVLLSFLVR
ncbi:protein kinase domain-containing protein [Actinomycetospora aeridis]|uniref:non-specific serine/threonine protein kinase n=1 Tax=Actinomycetospora aeridis TaxID=3129231 RepID=A0ABU8NEM7_9PSEU